jgi:large subunit ribosomal protein L30
MPARPPKNVVPGEARLVITQVRSAIGSKPKHRGTLRALGLRGIGQSNELPDRPEIRGMIARVPHLITIEEVSA